MNLPSTLGGFQITERLGAGAMGTVYRAVQSSLGRVVVIKTLHPHLAADLDLIARFEREARHAAHLQHQNTVQVIEFGQDDEVHYIAMEYVEGMDLKQILQLRGPFPIPIAMLVLRDVCRGLEAAHARDIVHRDIKPANLMITSQGVIKVMDFGLARETAESSTLTAAGSVMGSPAYMSPEQARGVPVDQQTDVFSTGLVGYEILSGARAFGGDSYPVVLHRVLNEEIPPLASLRPDIPSDLLELIEWMTRKDLTERCPSISEARDRLEAMVKQLSLKREDAILGEFARAAVAEQELQDPRPKISEARSAARTIAATSRNSSADGTVVSGDPRQARATFQAGTDLESGPHPARTGSPLTEGVSATFRPAAVEPSAESAEDSHAEGVSATSRPAAEEWARASGTASSKSEDARGRSAPSAGMRRRMAIALSSLGAVLLLGILGWVFLRPDEGTRTVLDNTDLTENDPDARQAQNDPGVDSGETGLIDEPRSRGGTDPTDDGGQTGTDPSGDPARTGIDGTDDGRTGTDPATDRAERTRAENDEQAGTDSGVDNRRNSNGNSDDNSDERVGSVGDQPVAPFRQEYSLSTYPGFAFIRVDGELINEDGNIPVSTVLREGRHTFQLTRSNGEDLGTLEYVVPRGDPNRLLILKFEDRIVEARAR